MKTNMSRLAAALTICLLAGVSLFSCDSKTENKAEKIQEEKQDVTEAAIEGEDIDKVREEQAEVESARKQYVRAWNEERDDIRDEVNAEIENIDEKLARYERDLTRATEKTKLNKALSDLKAQRARMTDQLKEVESATAENWESKKDRIEYMIDKIDNKVDSIKLD